MSRFTPEQIEKVARAICHAQGLDPDCHEGGTGQSRWQNRVVQAQAALEAAIPPGSPEERAQQAERVIEAARTVSKKCRPTSLQQALRAYDEACGKESP